MLTLFAISALGQSWCGVEAAEGAAASLAAQKVEWTMDESIDLAGFNGDLRPGQPTIDVAIYVPSNFDPKFTRVSVARMLDGLRYAKEIYRGVGLQINLLWVKRGEVDPRFLAIQANEIPRVPDTEYVNSYEASIRHPSVPTGMALEAFQSIIEVDENSHRTIYLVALQDVIFPFLEVSDGRNWTVKMVRTGGLSFPSYSYFRTIPPPYRGVMTITNLSTPGRLRRTIAHEIGHKVMNVSHEYMDIGPAHEIYAEGGLMLYGSGEDIPGGEEGRWHRERLLLSPYVYRLLDSGKKQWNPDYIEGGHYYDPIYGSKVIHFPGTAVMDEDW